MLDDNRDAPETIVIDDSDIGIHGCVGADCLHHRGTTSYSSTIRPEDMEPQHRQLHQYHAVEYVHIYQTCSMTIPLGTIRQEIYQRAEDEMNTAYDRLKALGRKNPYKHARITWEKVVAEWHLFRCPFYTPHT